MQSIRTFATRKSLMMGLGLVLLILFGVFAFLLLRQPSQQDYRSAQTDAIGSIASARKELRPLLNTYLAAFKKAYNESDSADVASKAAKPQYDAFKKAESKASSAMETLANSKVANDTETGASIRQLSQDYMAEVAYYDGLVESYPEYTEVFSQNSKGCAGVFVGETNGLADRKQKLDIASKNCFSALDTLKKSSNVTYVDYAKKIERRVKNMQEYAAVTAKSEAALKTFEAQAANFQKKADDATARGASEEELFKLADEIKALNAKINENKAGFDFAAKRYISTVKELPTLYDNVYSKDVPAKIKSFEQLIGVRTNVLSLVLDGKIRD